MNKLSDNYFWINGHEIARCSVCKTPIYGIDVLFPALISSRGEHEKIKCSKCEHVDPAFEVRTYGQPRQRGLYPPNTFEPTKVPWWSGKKPLWAMGE